MPLFYIANAVQSHLPMGLYALSVAGIPVLEAALLLLRREPKVGPAMAPTQKKGIMKARQSRATPLMFSASGIALMARPL